MRSSQLLLEYQNGTERSRSPHAHPQAPRALLRGAPAAPPSHTSLLGALEAAARDRAPLLTFHTGRAPEPCDAVATLELTRRFAHALHGGGVRPGERVLIVAPTSPGFVGALLGAMWLGAVPVPLAYPMTMGSAERFLQHMLAIARQSGASHLVTSERIRRALDAEPLAGELAGTSIAGITGCEAAPPPVPSRPLPYRHGTAVDAGSTAFLQYTSGTTGAPKGVVISQRAAIANAAAIAGGLGITPQDVGVSWLPLFHDMGLIGVLLTALCHPYPVHLMSPERFLMAPDNWLRLISQVGGTVTAAPNFAYDLCVTRNRADPAGLQLQSLRACLNGAEPVQAQTLARFGGHFAAAGLSATAQTPVYGMAENTLAVAFSATAEPPRTLRVDRELLETRGQLRTSTADGARTLVSVGTPVAGVSVAVCDAAGQPLPEGVVGEVRLAGDSLMDGYFRDDAASAAALRDGWLVTGDMGLVHGGALYLTGRATELIIKGGRNVYPYDLERTAMEVPGVVQGAVVAFGRPNGASGTDDIVLVVEARPREAAVRSALAREVTGAVLAALGFKVDEVILRPPGSLPRTSSGKLRRGRTRELSAEWRA